MDNIAIDQILSTVNGDDDMMFLTDDLQHRIPNFIGRPIGLDASRDNSKDNSLDASLNVTLDDAMNYDELPMNRHAHANANNNKMHSKVNNNKIYSNINNNINNNKMCVNRPIDPVNSVSSTENVSDCDSPNDINATTHEYVAPHEAPYQITKPKSTRRISQNKIRHNNKNLHEYEHEHEHEHEPEHKHTNLVTCKENNDNNNIGNNIDNDHGRDVSVPSHLMNIFGYNIPVSTLYFIIVLVIIAVGLYFLTAKKPPQERDKSKKRDESE